MSLEQGMKAYLEANLPAGTPLYPTVLPQDLATYPALIYALSDTRRYQTADGTSSTFPSGMRLILVGETYEQVKNLQSLVVPLIDSYTGPLGDRFVDGILIETELDGFEQETRLHTVTIFLELWNRSI